MKSKVWVELIESNAVVTDCYLRTIGAAYKALGRNVEFVYNTAACCGGEDDVYVVALAPSVLKLHMRSRKNVVFWSQGVWPEESLLRNGSKIRYRVCGVIEKRALEISKKVFLVSKAQQNYYEQKYGVDLGSKSYVMACSNEAFHKESFYYAGKYNKPVFIYAGSLAKYQCIDGMLDAFEQAATVIPDAKLLFYTGETEKAQRLVAERDLQNVTVDHADPEDLARVLARAKYGFVIRDDNPVNRVATPTKLSSYIANGVIPIYSKSLTAFEESSTSIVRLAYDKNSFASDIMSLESRELDPTLMRESYEEYFDQELNCSNKVGPISAFLETESHCE